MYSEQSLGGVESTKFWEYWNLIKTRVPELMNVGNLIKGQWNKAKALRGKTDDPEIIAKLNDKLFVWSDMYQTWKEVKVRFDKYLKDWIDIERQAGDDTHLGIVPFILPVWAITILLGGGLAALTFVATKGLDLLKSYQFEKNVLNQIEKGILKPGEASIIIESGKEAPIFGSFGAINTGIVLGGLGFVGLMFYQQWK